MHAYMHYTAVLMCSWLLLAINKVTNTSANKLFGKILTGPDRKTRTFCRIKKLSFASSHVDKKTITMGEKFQDYSWIQDFEADFP